MNDSPLPPDRVRQQLEHMLGGATFRAADRSSRLLRFVVEETLEGRADRLKDYTLGAEALGRGERFDPRTDPIARVEVSRLRSRLDLYYATEGAGDHVLIALPKGGYVPQFELRAPRVATPVSPPARAGRIGVAWVALAAAALAAAAAGAAWTVAASRYPEQAEVRLEVTTPPTTDPISLALSPDGRSLVFVASRDGISRLWLRRLDSTTARPLAGTENASLPFWSPDSRSIAFFADARVARIDLESGLVQAISRATVPAGGTWNRAGVILHTSVPDGPLLRTSADGAPSVRQTSLARGQTGHRAPCFLPDGRHFLFYTMGSPEVRGIYVGELGTTTTRRLLDADTPAVYLPAPSRLLYVTHGTLFAHDIDPASLTLVGDPVAVAEGVAVGTIANIAAITASSAGAFAYRGGTTGGSRQYAWFDRLGHEMERIGAPSTSGASYGSVTWSTRRLAVQRAFAGNADIYLTDLDRSAPVRLTSEPQADIAPIWSPQGDRIVYSSQDEGVFNLFVRRIGAPRSDLLLKTEYSKQATDWSRDGKWILFRTGPDLGDIWALPLTGDRTPVPVVKTQFEERDAQFSPDGRWIAYQSNELGRFEIYVRPFMREGEPVRISSAGGVQVRWRADGRELFYLTLDSQLVAVPVSGDGETFKAGTATPLFHASVGAVQDYSLHNYMVSPDGQRFLLDTVVEEPAAPITIVLNWSPRGRR